MRLLFSTAFGLLVLLVSHRSAAVTLTVTPEVIGTSPAKLGYNLAHFMPDTNVLDWWRYSGANAARIFLSSSLVSPGDDLPPFGDGVGSLSTFMDRRKSLRANPTSTTNSPPNTPAYLKQPFINWKSLNKRFETAKSEGNNRFRVNDTFSRLRSLHVDILVQITANSSDFPISSPTDWPGLWELWQHFYSQAYYLGRHYDVECYSMFNEPNHKAAAGITPADWLLRLRFASDAIQSAIADVNRDYHKKLIAQVHAPTTAGAIDSAFNDWGRPAIEGRHLRIDGTDDPAWSNFQVYSYQYYGMNPEKMGSQAFTLKNKVRSLMPKLPPFAITEFNIRTGANFDKIPDTLDQPDCAAALAADCIALTDAGIENLYLFKFGMTATGGGYSDYPVQKNGIHYVDNHKDAEANSYGGITLVGESWRLFNRMAGGSRDRLKVTADAPKANLAFIATHDKTDDSTYLYITNQEDQEIPIKINADALNLTIDTEIAISEVSARCYGTIRHLFKSDHGTLTPPNATMPAQSVWLVHIPHTSRTTNSSETLTLQADANTELRDGQFRKSPGPTGTTIRVSNGTISPDARRIAVIGFDLSSLDRSGIDSAVLSLAATSSKPGSPAQAHAYAITDNDWHESSLCWADFAPLRQKIPAGPRIRNNVISGDGLNILIQGQLHVEGDKPETVNIDVTAFLKTQTKRRATFIIVQESRWDTNLIGRKPKEIKIDDGDIQDAGLIIGSRTSQSPPILRIVRHVARSAVKNN